MDLALWASISQVVAALGVVVSLVYLAVQVRQAQRVARSENVREVQAGFVRIQEMLAQDAELARIYRLGCQDPARLDTIERQRFEHLMSLYFIHFIGCHTAHEDGLLDTALYEPWRHGVAAHLQTTGGREWWTAIRDHLKPDAVQAVEALEGRVGPPTELRTVKPASH